VTAAYGAIGRIDYGSRTNTVIPMPASVGDGDFLILGHITANSGTAVTQTLPAGWTQLGTVQTGSDGSFGWRFEQAARVASSEPSDYTVTHSSTNTEGIIIRIDGSGTMSVDVSSKNHTTGNSPTTATGTAVTTTVTDALLVFLALNWNEAALTVPSGMTERQDSQFLYLATQALSASGSTGTRTFTAGANPWFANMIAIKDVVGGGGGAPTKFMHLQKQHRRLWMPKKPGLIRRGWEPLGALKGAA